MGEDKPKAQDMAKGYSANQSITARHQKEGYNAQASVQARNTPVQSKPTENKK